MLTATHRAGQHDDSYETVAVTALPPGWRNVYRREDGTLDDSDPCPAILLQERRVEHQQSTAPPYTTIAVAACMGEGWLSPACEEPGFVATIGPGQTLDGLEAYLKGTSR